MNDLPRYIDFLRLCAIKTNSFPGGFRLGEYLRKKYSDLDREVLLSDFDDKLKIYVNLSDHIGGQIFWHGHYSSGQLLLASKLLKSTDVVFDIGANMGEFSVFAAHRVKDGFLHSFEPVQKLYNQTKRNIEANKFINANVYKMGFSNKNAELPIYHSIDRGSDGAVNSGLNSIYKEEGMLLAENIVVVKMDDWCLEHKINKIDLIKIDIEGAELFALQGAEETLRRLQPKMIVEVNQKTCLRAGYTARQLVDFILKLGYQIYNIDHLGQTKLVTDLDDVSRDVLCLPNHL